ncbi:BamA/TamA family outer membrane protein [Vibrio amylolyticus]|uniref:BamA/TamA family outer membrane protein n=1 Tax=Vibrio amylolyticus TaxID=2847292 RepID=UPI0035537127
MNKTCPLILACASTFFTSYTSASFFDNHDGQFDLGHHIAENAYGFLPVPILITEPAVGAGGGVAGLFLHEDEQAKARRKQAAFAAVDGGAQLMPAAITLVGAAGTENGSWFAFAGHRHSWLKDAIRYTGGLGVGEAKLDIYQPIQFDGIGTLPAIDTLRFGTTTQVAGLMQKLQFRVKDTPLMLGAKQVLAVSSVDLNFYGKLGQAIDKLSQHFNLEELDSASVTSGLGLVVDYDTRDNLFYPTQGYQLSAEYMAYDEAIGSDYSYQNLSLNGQIYLPLSDAWNLAFAGNYQHFSSDELLIAPTTKPYVALRGVSSYRYQGDEILTAQTQLSYDIDNRWKVSAFYGHGVAQQSDTTDALNHVDAYGVGFRYHIARRYGLRLGIDIAFSDQEGALYFNMGSGL